MNEENFDPVQSLRLIQSMIDKTKQDISNKSIYFLVWGWIIFIACTAQFILKHVYNYSKHYYHPKCPSNYDYKINIYIGMYGFHKYNILKFETMLFKLYFRHNTSHIIDISKKNHIVTTFNNKDEFENNFNKEQLLKTFKNLLFFSKIISVL